MAASRLVSLLNAHLALGVDADSPRLFAGLIPPNERKIEALRSGPGPAGWQRAGYQDCQAVLMSCGLLAVCGPCVGRPPRSAPPCPSIHPLASPAAR